MKQYVITPAAGKRLIGKGLAAHPAVRAVLKKGTFIVIAGTTNGYVAEEILRVTGQGNEFARRGFRRGVVGPPTLDWGTIEADFPGDVVLVDGVWQPGKTIFDLADDLRAGDVVLKGGNALDLGARQAAVYVGDPQGGTVLKAVTAAIGRRVQLMVPIGLEKRIAGDIRTIAALINAPQAQGPRLLPIPGEIFTELDALATLTGGQAHLLAGGGIYGAEGCIWLGVTGTEGQMAAADALLTSVAGEPLCQA